jgi:hypothetical protein
LNQQKEQHIEVEGVVSAVLAGTMFRVALANNHVVLAFLFSDFSFLQFQRFSVSAFALLTLGDIPRMAKSASSGNLGQ